MNTSSNALKLSQSTAPARASGPTQPSRLRRLGVTVWRTLETIGRVRARRELLALADRWESQRPELAAQMRAATNDMGCV
jgi:hypothetical protein